MRRIVLAGVALRPGPSMRGCLLAALMGGLGAALAGIVPHVASEEMGIIRAFLAQLLRAAAAAQ